MPDAASGHNYARAGKFGAIGVANTLLDFLIFNLMFGALGLPVLIANVISTTIAMTFSFFANRHLVFEASTGSARRQAVLFVVTTAFGLYVLQLGILHLLISVWHTPLNVVVSVVHGLGLGNTFHDTFVRNNAGKAFGVLVSMAWNYLMYKKVVFAE